MKQMQIRVSGIEQYFDHEGNRSQQIWNLTGLFEKLARRVENIRWGDRPTAKPKLEDLPAELMTMLHNSHDENENQKNILADI